jgi:hypothetical protein
MRRRQEVRFVPDDVVDLGLEALGLLDLSNTKTRANVVGGWS